MSGGRRSARISPRASLVRTAAALSSVRSYIQSVMRAHANAAWAGAKSGWVRTRASNSARATTLHGTSGAHTARRTLSSSRSPGVVTVPLLNAAMSGRPLAMAAFTDGSASDAS